MKKILMALGLLGSLSAGCTITPDDLTNELAGQLSVDKETILAYTQTAMKQAAISASAITAEVRGVQASPRQAPRKTPRDIRLASSLRKLAVTQEQCVAISDFLCNAEGTLCQYTEDYSACGNDYKGKITRKFEGDFETYKITIDFEGYAEKPSNDTSHFAFTGKSIMTGTIGLSSANLSMHTEGTIGSYIGGTYFNIQNSADTTFTYLNGALSINGTQSGKVVGTEQTTSISITELKFDGECEQGPVSGTVKTTIGGKESVTSVASCGNATLTINGEATPVSAQEIASTFVPDAGAGGERGFEGIIEGTDGGSLLTGTWYYESTTVHEWINIFDDGQGTIYFDFFNEADQDGDGTFTSVNDTFSGGYGSIVISGTSFTPTFDYYYEGQWIFNDQTATYEQQFLVEQNNFTADPLAFTLEGNSRLTIDGWVYVNLAGGGDTVSRPGGGGETMPGMSGWELNGYWYYDNGNTWEAWDIYEDTAGYTYLSYYKYVDVGGDMAYWTENDTDVNWYGEFTKDEFAGTFTPMWDYGYSVTYPASFTNGTETYTIFYDSYDNAGALMVDDPVAYSVGMTSATIRGVTFYR